MLLAQTSATPTPDDRRAVHDAAAFAYRDCVLLNARRYATAPDAADLVARAALAACTRENAETERTMYGIETGPRSVVEQTMRLMESLLRERAIKEVIETRSAARR